MEAPEGEGAEICENETIPTLTVTVGDGETADWYDANGNLVADNTHHFHPDSSRNVLGASARHDHRLCEQHFDGHHLAHLRKPDHPC